MQAQHSTAGEVVEKFTSTEYKFCCCQCTKDEVNDIVQNSDPSTENVVTWQPNSVTGNNNSFQFKYAPESSSDISRTNQLQQKMRNGGERTTSAIRLKEESTHVTSAVLDRLIHETNHIDRKQELQASEEKITLDEILREQPQIEPKNTPRETAQKFSTSLNTHKTASERDALAESMKRTVIENSDDLQQSDALNDSTRSRHEKPPEIALQSEPEGLSKPILPKSDISRIIQVPSTITSTTAADVHSNNAVSDDDRESHVVSAGHNDSANFKDANEDNNLALVSKNISEQTAFSKQPEGNHRQTTKPKTTPNKSEFSEHGADKSNEDEGGSSISVESLNNLSEVKQLSRKTSTTEAQCISMICIPDEDTAPSKAPKNDSNALEFLKFEEDHDNKSNARPNKMYASIISSTSSSDEEGSRDESVENGTDFDNVVDGSKKKSIERHKFKNTKEQGNTDALKNQSTTYNMERKAERSMVTEELFPGDEFNERLI